MKNDRYRGMKSKSGDRMYSEDKKVVQVTEWMSKVVERREREIK